MFVLKAAKSGPMNILRSTLTGGSFFRATLVSQNPPKAQLLSMTAQFYIDKSVGFQILKSSLAYGHRKAQGHNFSFIVRTSRREVPP